MEEKRVVPTPLKTVLDWDIAVTEKVVKYVDQHYGPLSKYRHLMKGLEISCHGILWLVATPVFIFLIESRLVRQLLVNIFIALIFDIIVVAVLKALTRRRRPTEYGSIAMDKFSFPSGHATRAVMLSVLLPIQYDLWLLVTMMLIGWGVAVSISRILLRRHHILDVLGGIIVGILEAIFMSLIWLSSESAQRLVYFFLDETQVGASYDV